MPEPFGMSEGSPDKVCGPTLSDENSPNGIAEVAGRSEWSPRAVVADIATLGGGSILSAIFNVVLVFLIPKVVSIADYGYWRLFLLYGAYVGILHLGLPDGALLKWAGKELEDFRDEILPSMKFLLWQNLAVILPLCFILTIVLPANLRFVGIAVVVFALVRNLTTLIQFGLQAGRRFRPVAISTAAPLGLLLIFVAARAPFSMPDYRELIIAYALAYLFTFGWLLARTKPWNRVKTLGSARTGSSLIVAGWPILLANFSFTFLQRMDRFAVSWASNIQNFAQYSLAGSALIVPILVIQTAYKVFFPHLAGVSVDKQALIYRSTSRLLLMVWVISLPYYFLLQLFVTDFLPRYVPGLAVARILLLGIIFLAIVQVLHMNYSFLNGRQRNFLVRTIAVLVLGLGLTSFAAFVIRSLVAVAAAEVLVLGLWWLVNEWSMRDLTGHGPGQWVKFVTVAGSAGLCYWLPASYGVRPVFSLMLYCGAATLIVLIAFRPEYQLCMRIMRRSPAVPR